MIKLKLGELKSCEVALGGLMSTRMPMVVAFKMSKLADKITEELKRFEEVRVDLINKLGESQSDGTVKIVDSEKMEEFTNELNILLDSEVSIEGDKLKITELGDGIEITPADLHLLSKYFIEA